MSRSLQASRAGAVALPLAFTLTGLAWVLPGVLLPLLLPVWGWNDRHAGQWFLAMAGGSALGPLVLRRNPLGSAAVGFLLSAVAAGIWSRGSSFAVPAGLVWGLGLGMAMTGISLGSQQMVPDATAIFLRLNFLWAVGALMSPLLAGPLWHWLGVAGLLRGAGGLLALAGAVLAMVAHNAKPATVGLLPRPGNLELRGLFARAGGIPFPLFAATAISTGVEASGGAWLATYAARSSHVLAITVAAPGCLWAGLLSSRALGWLRAGSIERRLPVRLFLVLVALAMAAILLPFTRETLLVGSFVLGFGLGPLYPALLARCLALRQTSLVFFAAGLASSIMPWATGVVSTSTGLLRLGLLVPALGAALLLGLGWRATAAARPTDQQIRSVTAS